MKNSSWILAPGKYLTKAEADRLLEVAQCMAQAARSRGRKVAVRDYFIVHLAISTGLRVMEIADLKCGDLYLSSDVPCRLIVRNGKGGRRRAVLFSGTLKKHCQQYLTWKKQTGESLGADSPLIVSSNTGGHMTTRAMQKAFKRTAEKAGLYEDYSIHCLRHTYACFLLKASRWNMRLVQKQLGHARMETTQVYADVMMPDVQAALNRLNI